jgi:acetyltransferase-like isoleucine patch superfamily enzyme
MPVSADDLRLVYAGLRDEMRDRFERDLPFEELLFDRWERASHLGFGPGANIYHSAFVYGDVRVGDDTWIGPYTLLDGSGGLSIGRGCNISAGVQIYSHDSVARCLSGGAADVTKAAVRIGDYVYVGPLSLIGQGVTIGDRALVGGHSFVNRDVEANAIVAGSPAKRIGTVVVDGSDVRLEYHGD